MTDAKFTDLLGDPPSAEPLGILVGILEAEIRRQPNSNLAAARLQVLSTGETKAVLVLATGCAGQWLDTMLDHAARAQERRNRCAVSGGFPAGGISGVH